MDNEQSMKVQATLPKGEHSYGVGFRDERTWNKGSHDWKISSWSWWAFNIYKLEIKCRNKLSCTLKKQTAKALYKLGMVIIDWEMVDYHSRLDSNQ